MKPHLSIWILALVLLASSCRKDSLLTSREARLGIGSDSVRFDTVFTTAGSVTKFFLLRNENNQKIRISRLELSGGTSSAFRINVDGQPGTIFTDLELAANDSMYVFVSVNVNPGASNQPFVIRDSIRIDWNGNTAFKQLEAWGQNARYIRSTLFRGNFRWTNELPYVVLGGMIVDTNSVLTIDPGTRVYFNADAPMIIDGTLIINGTKTDSVVFQGNRLDEPYRNFPASWPGIFFRGSSINNRLNYTYLLNAFQGVVADQPAANSNPKVVLNNCVLDNIFDAGIFAVRSSVEANNCLISNCGNNIALLYGGNYSFTHCTVVSYSNSFVQHKNPVVTATNFARQNGLLVTAPLAATFTNCILWGEGGLVDNELVVQREGASPAAVQLNHVLLKVRNDPANTTFTNVIRNQTPLFDSVDVSRRLYNFRLKTGSPAINQGMPTALLTDLDGRSRLGLPDLGCYEKQ